MLPLNGADGMVLGDKYAGVAVVAEEYPSEFKDRTRTWYDCPVTNPVKTADRTDDPRTTVEE